MFQYKAKAIRMVDGDTLWVDKGTHLNQELLDKGLAEPQADY